MRLLLPGLFALVLLAACNRPSLDQCEQLCRDYSELAYFDKVDRSLADQPPEEQKRRRAEKKKEWESKQKDSVFLRRLDNCVTDCRHSGDKEMVGCVHEAETVDQAKACLKD